MSNDGISRETELGRRLARVPAALEKLGGADECRREPLIERAEEHGLDRVTAGEVHDLALDEGLNPSYGLALAMAGISVQPLDGPRPDVETSDPNEPDWVDTPPTPDRALRERRIRQTFRRFRTDMAESESFDAALRQLATDPDVEPYDF
ncbi:MAG: hypothetical protein ACOCVZ_06240 [Gemmatimonadota bacterium]